MNSCKMPAKAKVWTHTKCAANQQVAMKRSGDGGFQCIKLGGRKSPKFHAMCCADTDGHYCHDCPGNDNKATDMDDVYECQPDADYFANYPVTDSKKTPGGKGRDELEFIKVSLTCPK